MLNKILVIGRATTHDDNELESPLKEKNASYILIPPGLTKYILPLDVSINAPFKKYMHHQYIDFILENQNKKKSSEEDIINAIDKIWFNEKYITKEQIIKSFKIISRIAPLTKNHKKPQNPQL